MVKVKDYVPDDQRRELVKKYGTAGEMNRPYIKAADVLKYLEEPRTTQEIQARFGYATLATAYGAIRLHLKNNTVAPMGHGLYISTSSKMNTFRVQDLTEHERQERGLEAFNKTLKAAATPTQTIEDINHAELDKRHVHIKPGGRKVGSKNIPIKELVRFADKPRTVREYMDKFGYTTNAGVMVRLKNLMNLGLLVKVAPPGGYQGYAMFWVQDPKTIARADWEGATTIDEWVDEPAKVAKPKVTRDHTFHYDDDLVKFARVPRSVIDYRREFGYTSHTAVMKRLNRLTRLGRLAMVPVPTSFKRTTAGSPPTIWVQATGQVPEQPTITYKGLPLIKSDKTVEKYVETLTTAPTNVERLAMQYAWEVEELSSMDKHVLRDFINWAKAKEEDGHE